MSCSARIDGSLLAPGDGPGTGLMLSGRWAATYDWIAESAAKSRAPVTLASLGFPTPFDADLAGALRGRRSRSAFSYLFKDGQFLRLLNPGLVPDGGPQPTPAAWGLPAHWTTLDAVFSGGGKKSDFAYFVRGDEYCRFDWSIEGGSPGYPKRLAAEWQLPPEFEQDLDGAVVGQGAQQGKVYLFKTLPVTVDQQGNPVPAWMLGGTLVRAPACIRYDFDAGRVDFTVTNPADLVQGWDGLFPLLDAGPAIDQAIAWCDRGRDDLRGGQAGDDLVRYFKIADGSSPTTEENAAIVDRLRAVRARLSGIPDRFRYTAGLVQPTQTSPQTLTEIGDLFSIQHGPRGRVMAMIQEAIRFTNRDGSLFDQPARSERPQD